MLRLSYDYLEVDGPELLDRDSLEVVGELIPAEPESFYHVELGQQFLEFLEVLDFETEGLLELVDFLGVFDQVVDLLLQVPEEVHDGVDVLFLVVEVRGVEQVLQELDFIADLRDLS